MVNYFIKNFLCNIKYIENHHNIKITIKKIVRSLRAMLALRYPSKSICSISHARHFSLNLFSPYKTWLVKSAVKSVVKSVVKSAVKSVVKAAVKPAVKSAVKYVAKTFATS